MVNIYFLYCTANAVPSGWSEISATYQGRFAKLATSSLLTTAGSDTHTHTVSTKPTLASGGLTFSSAGTSGVWIGALNHTHSASTADQSIDAGTETSLPYYKNYRMIYRDASTFTGVVPAYAAILRGALPSSSEPDYDHWGWDENADCYIRIASSYGGTGGADSHVHPCTLAWNLAIVESAERSSGSVVFNKGAYSHGHISTGINTDTTAHTYRWWGAGVCKVTQETNGFPAGSYAWFDGAVPSGWTAVTSYNGYFCKNRGSSDRTVAQGGTDATHTHTVTGPCGGCSSGTSQTALGGSTYYGLLYTHTHAITGGVYSSTLPVPSNFTLQLASIDATLVPMTTRTKTYTMDVLLKQSHLENYTSDLLIKKMGIQKTYLMDLLIKKGGLTKSVNMDILVRKACLKSLAMDILLKKLAIIKPYQMDLLLSKFLAKTYQADILLQQTMNKSINIDILLKKSITSTYSMNIIIINITAKQKQYEMDIIIKNLGLINTYEMNLLIKRFNLTKSYAMDLIISSGSGSTKSYSMGIILAFPLSTYRQRRHVHMDSQLQPVEITQGHDNYTFDPIGNELRQKRDIPATSKHTASTEMTKGFDPFVHDDIPRKKREFINAS